MRALLSIIAVIFAIGGCSREAEHELIGTWTSATVNSCGRGGESFHFKDDSIIFRTGKIRATMAVIDEWSEPQDGVIDLKLRRNLSTSGDVVLGRPQIWRFNVDDEKANVESTSLDGQTFEPLTDERTKELLDLRRCD